MKKKLKIYLIIVVIGANLLPFSVLAASPAKFYYAGWIPFWKKESGVQDITDHLRSVQELSPFSYEVRANGTLVDKLKINEGFWPGWLSAVHDFGIKIIPTIAWFDGNGIQTLLSNTKKRLAHEEVIKKLVKDNKFDGVDIDYESKLAKTNKYFATFIYGLAIRLHPLGKKLACTVEARTPASSRLNSTGTPADFEYANDYPTLNKYCDEVRIMAYDQGVIDIKLDQAKGDGKLYAPVADPAWVEKVIRETTKTISPKKIMLGTPTYGYEYEVSWANGVTTYKRLRTHTFLQAMARSNSVGVAPARNSAGELSFTYATSTAVNGVSTDLIWAIPSTTTPVEIATNAANGKVTRFVSFSDAEAAADKINLAKKLKLRGVVFFKLDGEADPALWNKIK